MQWDEPVKGGEDAGIRFLHSLPQVLERRKYVLVLTPLIFTAAAIVMSMLQPPVYEAAARILIERDNPRIMNYEDILTVKTSDDYYQTQYTILKSRRLAQRVMDKLHLMQTEPYSSAADPLALLIDDYMIEPIKGSRLVDVKMRGRHPEKLSTIVNCLASEYVEMNLEWRVEASQGAYNELIRQNEGLRATLEVSEQRLLEYAEQVNMVSVQQQREISDRRILSYEAELTQVRTALLKNRTKLKELARIQDDPVKLAAFPDIYTNGFLQENQRQLMLLTTEKQSAARRYRERHPEMIKLQAQIDELERQRNAEIERIAENLRMNLDNLQAQQADLQQALEAEKKAALQAQRSLLEYESLGRDVESNRQMYADLLQRQKEIDLSSGIDSNNIRILDFAQVPTIPVLPRKGLNATLGLLLGLCAGIFAVAVQERLDTRFRSVDDVRRLSGLPVLGFLFNLASIDEEAELSEQAVVAHPTGIITEQFRDIRTALMFTAREHDDRVLMVASALKGEGKSFVTTNLGLSFGQSGDKVLLIDSDMRKPRLHKIFNLRNDVGLSSVLSGSVRTRDAIRSINDMVDVLPAGPQPPNPSELLSSAALRAMLSELEQTYKRIIIDTTPLLSVSDGLLVGRHVSGVLLVIATGGARQDDVRMAAERLRSSKIRLLGTVLNNVEETSELRRAKYGGYGMYYSRSE
ncbi:polysaccharide biosynthesis tyrosine autokinase [bacterium]|nr:polysaccharide biosynthesis tyrosine autokinase [candidate division CSSED10-310 bacterium]